MITCQNCGYENALSIEFCEACGSELKAVSVDPTSSPTIIQKSAPSIENSRDEIIEIQRPLPQPTPAATNVSSPTISANTARLISKQAGTSVSEFSLDGNSAIVGRFDPDSGPVDVDLEGFPGEETVSRGHAEIYYETGQWKAKDLGSTNGVFIKRSGQSRFGARITMPETLNSGDEIAFGKIRFLFHNP